MTSSTIVGVDPGAHGAIAILDENGQLLGVEDMPTTPKANGRTATSAPLLATILARTHARVAFCEFVGAQTQRADGCVRLRPRSWCHRGLRRRARPADQVFDAADLEALDWGSPGRRG